MPSVKKMAGWIILALIAYLILTYPQLTAGWVKNVFAHIEDAFNRLATFLGGIWS